MINKKIVLIPALFILFLFYSCSESPTSIGVNLLSPDYINVHKFDSYQDSVQQTSTYYKTLIKLSDSPRLFVGNFANLQTSSLIRFGIALPDTIKNDIINSNLSIISSKIALTKEYSIGDSSAQLNFTVHSVTSGWTSLGFNADSLPTLVYDNTDISSNKNLTDSLYSFDISTSTVLSWFTAAADTAIPTDKGIYLKPDPASNRIIGFDAFNVNLVGIPTLTVVVQKLGSYTDTLTFYSIEDVTAIGGDKPTVPAGDIAVQGGLAVYSRIQFDVSSIAKGSVINKAQLTLYLDSSATLLSDAYTNSISAYFSKDTTTNSYDSTSAIVLNRVDNYFTGDIARFIQSITSGYHENQGIVLAAGGQNIGVDLFALKGSSTPDASLRPRLVITYTGRK